MNNDDALYLLGLEGAADASAVRHAYERRRLECEQKISNASTDGLKQKYHSTLSDLDQAYRMLLGSSQPHSSATRSANSPSISASVSTGGTLLRAERTETAHDGLAVGHVLANRYEIRRILGQGGMGAVFEAFDRLKQESVAVKVLLPQYLESAQGRDRFMHEAKIACRLAHPNIVKVFDVGLDAPYHFITMELLEGETLRQQMENRKYARNPYTVHEVLGYAQQLIAALDYAHKQIVHRDLKPENVWVCPDGTLKLIDFGIARAFTKSALTRTGMVMGTAYYMAPEQFDGARDVDWRADQYSLAVILYELLAGRIPQGSFAATRELRKDVPMLLSRGLMTALSPDPSTRFPSLTQLGVALASRDTLPMLRHRKSLWILGGTMVAAGAAMVWMLGDFASPPSAPTEPTEATEPHPAAIAVPPPASTVTATDSSDATINTLAALESEVLDLYKRLQERQRAVDTAVEQQAQVYNRALADVAAAGNTGARRTAEARVTQVAGELQVQHDLQEELRATAFSEGRRTELLAQIQSAQAAVQNKQMEAARKQFAAARTALLATAQKANDVERFVHARAAYFEAKRQWVEYSALRSVSLPSYSPIPMVEAGIQPAVNRGEYAHLATTVLPGLTAQYAAVLRDSRRAETRVVQPRSAEVAPVEQVTEEASETPPTSAPAANAPVLTPREQALADRTRAQAERRRAEFLARCEKARRRPEGCPAPASK